MIATVFSAGIYGIEGYLVTVECGLVNGLPSFELVGLPGAAVKESKERVTTAARSIGMALLPARKTVNLAPADIRKEGAVYDLPILLGLLAAQGNIEQQLPDDSVFIGEIGLRGELRPVKGALSMAMAVQQAGKSKLFLPEGNAEEASLIGNDLTIYAVRHVQQILDHLTGKQLLEPYVPEHLVQDTPDAALDFCDVMGQENVKRAMEIAAAGGHNMLMSGSPGSGKSMMAKRIGTILPPMTPEEKMDVVRIYSIIGEGSSAARSQMRPVRAPHHTTSAAGIAGGGQGIPMPGELSLAHNGVLFLDELPEFRKDVLEVLRQPLEDGEVTVSRVAGTETFPANFMLVCAMNPCKCGWYGHPSGRCRCSANEVRAYHSRISGPLLDRIDIIVEAPALEYEELKNRAPAESSDDIKRRVDAARLIQRKRFEGTGILSNAGMSTKALNAYCILTPECEHLMHDAFDRMGLTARSYDRILRVARTIADLEGEEAIGAMHIAEAIQYRTYDFREV